MTFRIFAATAAVLAYVAAAHPAAAQTDYYNTDQGRPVRIEDAAPVERYAFELQLAPVRMEREGGGAYHWEIAPEIAYGILPHTQLEVGFPFAFVDAGDERTEGLAGIEIAALHNLNVETRTLPAFAVAAEVLLPVGALAPSETYATAKGIATRTFPGIRIHVNGQYTLGPDGEDGDVGDVSRWMAGVAADRAFPLRALLVTADLFAEQALAGDEEVEWTAEAGLRYQTSPQFNIDFGVGRRLSADEHGWFFTFGAAHAFAVRNLLPIR